MAVSCDDVYYELMHAILIGDPLRGGVVSEPTQLLSHVYIGSQANAEQLRLLRHIGVTHVLNCAGYKGRRTSYASPYDGCGIEYYEFQAEDSDRYNITQHFSEAFTYLDNVKRVGGVALVHCALGINRSAAVCLAYIMTDRRLPLLEATRMLKNKRRIVLVNKAFQRQLIRFARNRNLLDRIDLPAQDIDSDVRAENKFRLSNDTFSLPSALYRPTTSSLSVERLGLLRPSRFSAEAISGSEWRYTRAKPVARYNSGYF